jgi:hypothetical protein
MPLIIRGWSHFFILRLNLMVCKIYLEFLMTCVIETLKDMYHALKNSKRVILVVGAGISASAGIEVNN